MTANPCFRCGMCCQYFRVSFYQGEVDGNGVGTVPVELTTKLSDHLVCMKGTEKGSAPCAALLHAKEGGYRCSIYEKRPSTCRDFNIVDQNGVANPECQKLQEIARSRTLSEPS